MKHISILVVMALIMSSTLATLTAVQPVTAAAAFTPDPVAVRIGSNVKDSLAISVSGDGRIYVAWSEKTVDDSNIMFSYSSNNGTTFAPAKIANNNMDGAQRNCEIATVNDTLLMVWEDGGTDSGDIILSRSDDGGTSFDEIHVSNHEDGTQSNPTIAAEGDRVAIAWEEFRSDNTIRIWNGGSGALVRNISGHQGAVRAIEFSPGAGTYLASGSEDSTVRVWNAATGTLLRNLTSHSRAVTSVNWSADGKMLAAGSFDHNVTLYNTTDYSIITRLNSTGGVPTRNFVNAVAFSPNGSQIAAAYNGGYGTGTPTGLPVQDFNLTVWNLTDYSSWTKNELNGGHWYQSVTDTAFSNSGARIASGSKDKTVKIWNSANGSLLGTTDLGLAVLSLSWSPNDSFIAAGLGNGSLAIVNSSNPADVYWMVGIHTGGVNSVDWNAVENEICSGASDPTAKIWWDGGSIRHGTERLNISGHLNSVYSVDWSSNGQLMVTAGGASNQYGLNENQVFCAVSEDGGLTFSPPVLVSDSCSSDRLRPKAAIGGGVISVAWYDSRNGDQDIYFANSTNGGLTYNPNVGIALATGEDVTPDLFMDSNGTAHVVWQYGLGAGIRYSNSTDGFAQSVIIATTAQIPHITGSRDGDAIWVSWRTKNTTTNQYSIRAAVSFDRGTTFPDSAILNSTLNFLGDHAICVDGHNQTFASWETNELPNENIYFRTTVLSDIWQPRVISTSPAAGETGISIFTDFAILFSEPMDRLSTEAAFSWTDGTTTWDVADCVGNQGNWSSYGEYVTFQPKVPLQYQKSGYSLKVSTSAKDLAGNSLAQNVTIAFMTGNDIDPPKIEYHPTQANVSYDMEYYVMALVTDQWGTIDQVQLYYQGVDDISPLNSIEMTLTYPDTYMAMIPAQMSLGTIYYYIEASDEYSNTVWSPTNYTNQSQLYSVLVIDGVKPEISHIAMTESNVYATIDIWAVVSDHIQLQNVSLYYRQIGTSSYTRTLMQPDSNGTLNAFTYRIPAQTGIGQVHYNITALDSSGNSNSTDTYSIQIVDRTAPMINSVKPTYLENQTKVMIRANVTDDVGVDSVTLYFKAVGGDQWVPRPMSNTGGDIYEFTIPAQDSSGTLYYYVNATDIYGNEASTLSEQDEYQIEVIGVAADYTLYIILGIVLAILTAIMVILLVRKYSRPRRDDEDVTEPSEEESNPEKVDETP